MMLLKWLVSVDAVVLRNVERGADGRRGRGTAPVAGKLPSMAEGVTEVILLDDAAL